MSSSQKEATVLDGKVLADKVKCEIKEDVASLRRVTPGLATVLVGERTDSATYVRMKIKACEGCGIRSVHKSLPVSSSEAEILNVIRELNADDTIHGILVQLPLPPDINEERVLAEISIDKDVDGFHPWNIGRLAMKDRTPLYTPCTPRACVELLKRSEIQISGKEVVVIGRSNIVGLPVFLLLMHENATVTIAHSKTANLSEVVSRADIVIAAVGRAEIVKGNWLKPGCVVIDVGINTKPDPTKKRGYRLVGDVDFEDCKTTAGFITPVPGGVGPMTIAMLLRNCVDAALREEKKTGSVP